MNLILDEKEICQAIADYVCKKLGRAIHVNVGINVYSKNVSPEKIEAIVKEIDGETK